MRVATMLPVAGAYAALATALPVLPVRVDEPGTRVKAWSSQGLGGLAQAIPGSRLLLLGPVLDEAVEEQPAARRDVDSERLEAPIGAAIRRLRRQGRVEI